MANIDQLENALTTAFMHGTLRGVDDDFLEADAQNAARFSLKYIGARSGHQATFGFDRFKAADGRHYTRMVIANDNMPFLVDSIASILAGLGMTVDRVIHPVIAVRRDGDGNLLEILAGETEGEIRESIIYMEFQRLDKKSLDRIKNALVGSLEDVRAAVDDWALMKAALKKDADAISGGEEAALLRWFLDRNLTQLAHFTYRRDGGIVDALGLARQGNKSLLTETSWQKALGWFESGHSAPLVIKSNFISTVHRRVPLDLFILPIWEDGKINALSVHAGIWTSTALAAFPEKVPMMRANLKLLMEKFGFDADGHAGKALTHAMTALPHDLMMGFSLDNLERLSLAYMSLTDRPRPKIITVRSALERHLFAFVWLPRDEISTLRRKMIEKMLNEAANAPTLSWSIAMENSEIALIRYVLDMRDAAHHVDDRALDFRLREMLRGWAPSVEEALEAAGHAEQAAQLRQKYCDAFPPSYRDLYGAEAAANDILRLEALEKGGTRDARLYRKDDDPAHRLRLKLYSSKGSIALSEAVPVLENYGFDVLEEIPTPLAEGELGYIHDFLLNLNAEDAAQELLDRAGMIERAISATLLRLAENDVFNKLIANIGLSQRSVVWLRAWFRYLRQTGLSYGMETVVDALHDAPDIARALISLFSVMHDPDFEGDRKAASKKALNEIRVGLVKVSAIDDDRILRLLRELIQAMLRTNAFAPAARKALAFKIDSAKVPGLPKPLPWREIFVYSPRVEGIHLRAGPVARGGLRWSDRRDDFRTEVLGLVKAQRVKNAVIVPTGAKGGFFPKQLPDPSQDREAWLTEGKESYKLFISTLLTVTDNIVDGKVVHPERVMIHDGEDPYFVVAADKGTATFSDTANAIAQEKNFWLGDAFASGGSNGYDHKAMGITARGAWVSVQRHFAEMGVDVQSESIRVAGCGDMSGDVFGNGMLLSKALKLVAAFDHRHIFFDPDPDPAKGWDERERMFELPRSSWDDYDKNLISKGGGVFARSLKTIEISSEIQEILGVEQSEMEPDALITAILKSKVDLLWFGGIGTYVKAAAENNVNVGDPANDPLRVDAEDLQAKAIGEGANLGITQAARIAFALKGGRINTDFIDNSAGVDCSDNEVNIKIGLNAVMSAGKLDEEPRNQLLSAMTDEVAELVLDDNRLQALGLSIGSKGGGDSLPAYLRLIEKFEDSGKLDRKVEGIADNDMLMRRVAEGKGLVRPEMAVLMSTAKLTLQEAIEATNISKDPDMDSELLAAFPSQMREKYPDILRQHQLRNEIIATKIANRLINRMGVIHPFEITDEEGVGLGEIATAFIVAEQLFDLASLWSAIDAAKIDEDLRLRLYRRVSHLARPHIADILRLSSDQDLPGALIKRLKPGVDDLKNNMDRLLNEEAHAQSKAECDAMIAAGASEEIAHQIITLAKLDGATGLAELAVTSGNNPVELTHAFTEIGRNMGIDWAQLTAASMSPSDPWERLLIAGIARDFQQMRLDFLARRGCEDPKQCVADWLEQHQDRVDRFYKLVIRIQDNLNPSASMMAQIASQARMLLARS